MPSQHPRRFPRPASRMKVSVITLGCDKNTVDSERYVAQLADRGAEYTDDMADADVIVVNTCGFIDAAKKESIDALVEAGRLKDDGTLQGRRRRRLHGAAPQGRADRRAARSRPLPRRRPRWIA